MPRAPQQAFNGLSNAKASLSKLKKLLRSYFRGCFKGCGWSRTSQPGRQEGALGEELSISFEGGGSGAHRADGAGTEGAGPAESLALASEERLIELVGEVGPLQAWQGGGAARGDGALLREVI